MPSPLRPLLLAYVTLLPLRRLEFLPLVGQLGPVIHLTEVLFLLLVPLVLYYVGRQLRPTANALTLGAIGLLAVLTVSTLRADHPHGYFELLGRYYLFAVFLLFCWATRHFGPPFLRAVFRYWYYGAAALAFLAYLGYPLAVLFDWTGLVSVYEDYPYFGTVFRASATAGGATALILLTLLPALYDYWRWRTDRRTPWFLLICLPLFVLTFSKEVLLLPVALLVLEGAFGKPRPIRYPVAAVLVVVYQFSTHYFVQPRQDISHTTYATAEYSPGKVAYRGNDFQLLETTYTALKRAAIYQVARHPLMGLGADQFQQRLRDDRPVSIYPAHLPPYGPHSTWFGLLAEAGVLGLLAVIAMVYGLARRLRHNLRVPASPTYALDYCLLAFFVALAVASVNCDLLHLQYVWVPLALVMGQVGDNWAANE